MSAIVERLECGAMVGGGYVQTLAATPLGVVVETYAEGGGCIRTDLVGLDIYVHELGDAIRHPSAENCLAFIRAYGIARQLRDDLAAELRTIDVSATVAP